MLLILEAPAHRTAYPQPPKRMTHSAAGAAKGCFLGAASHIDVITAVQYDVLYSSFVFLSCLPQIHLVNRSDEHPVPDFAVNVKPGITSTRFRSPIFSDHRMRPGCCPKYEFSRLRQRVFPGRPVRPKYELSYLRQIFPIILAVVNMNFHVCDKAGSCPHDPS